VVDEPVSKAAIAAERKKNKQLERELRKKERAIKHLLTRAFVVFKDDAFERLSHISVAQIYNLRATDRY
jgi:uncharacterized protein YktB (UPF0637 family)